MFRARFSEAFPKSLANFGPQELERDVVDTVPGERVEAFLCALLSLLLNRKQDVKCVSSLEEDTGSISFVRPADGAVSTDPDTTTVRSKKLFRHTRGSGRRTGKAKTRSRARPPLPR